MPVMQTDYYAGVEFAEELMDSTPYRFAETVPLDHLRIVNVGDLMKVALSPEILGWIEHECEGEAVLACERDSFLIAFNNIVDATMSRIRYAGAE